MTTPMTEPKDIIGIVKELQGEHNSDYLMQGAKLQTASENHHLDVVGPLAHHLGKLHNHFPAIAQALLEAERVLEEICRTYDPYTDRSDMYMNEKAKAALALLHAPINE